MKRSEKIGDRLNDRPRNLSQYFDAMEKYADQNYRPSQIVGWGKDNPPRQRTLGTLWLWGIAAAASAACLVVTLLQGIDWAESTLPLLSVWL